MSRRGVVAIIGQGGLVDPHIERVAEELACGIVDLGARVVTGGLDGVMAAACRGARGSGRYREGDVIGVLPGSNVNAANPWVDIVVPTGMGIARNVLVVSMSDVVVAVSGGAGTLSELAVAWQLGKPIVALSSCGGWSERLAGTAVDPRPRSTIVNAKDVASAVEAVGRALGSVLADPKP